MVNTVASAVRPDLRPAYSEVMEDYAVVSSALALRATDVVVSISSAGDNALNAVLEGPRHVFAVDILPVQTELCRLKESALRALDWRELADLLGVGEATPERRRALLARLPRAQVARALGDPAAREAAERHGLASCGKLSAFVEPLRDAVSALVGREALERLLCEPRRERRERLWRERFETDELLALLGAALNEQTIADAFIPASAFGRMAEPRFGVFYHRVLRHLAIDLDPRRNPFVHRLWLGRFPSPRGLPAYLLERNHARLRKRLDALTWHTADLLDFLRTLPPASVDAYNLSNVLDWSSDAHHDALWREVDRTAAAGARVFLRSFLAARAGASALVPGWSQAAERSEPMARSDRVGYFSRYELWTRA